MIAYQRDLGVEQLFPTASLNTSPWGLSVLAPQYSPEILKLLDEYDVGRGVDFEDPAAIAEAIEQTTRAPDQVAAQGARAARAFEKSLSWEKQFDPLVRALERAT